MANVACPFCVALSRAKPQLGEKIIFLSGVAVGRRGTVVPMSATNLRAGSFLVQIEDEPAHFQKISNQEFELFLNIKDMTVPDWMPSISIEDNEKIHDCLLTSYRVPMRPGTLRVDDFIIRAASLCWARRLPVTGNDIWRLASSHGVDKKLEKLMVERFDFGVRVLVHSKGRPAIERKRMPPMSRGRYMTKNH